MVVIKKSLRERSRYVSFQVFSDEQIFLNDVKLIPSLLSEFLGVLGMSQALPYFVHQKWDNNKKVGVLKVVNGWENHVKVGLTLIRKLNNKDVIIKTGKTSGTLKKLSKILNEVKFYNG